MGCTSKFCEHSRPLLKQKFEIVDFIKSHRLTETDVLKVDTQKLINKIKVEEQDIGILKAWVKYKSGQMWI